MAEGSVGEEGYPRDAPVSQGEPDQVLAEGDLSGLEGRISHEPGDGPPGVAIDLQVDLVGDHVAAHQGARNS